MRSVLVLVVAACSSSGSNRPAPVSPSPPPATPSPAAPSPPPNARRAITAEAFCERWARLTAECEPFAKAGLAANTCVAETSAVLAREHLNPQLLTIIRCAVESDGCDDALQCIALDLEEPSATDAALRACHDRSPGHTLRAVGIPRSEWERRNGAGVTTFRDARSTELAPIEMCGVAAANEWLTTLRCDDGSQPIEDHRDAEDTRSGNIGPGGRCRSIIDRYVVLCPERRYEIFIDAYICPRPE